MNTPHIELTYTELPQKFWTKQLPTPVVHPKIVTWNEELAQNLGIKMTDDSNLVHILSGNEPFEGINPIAQSYAGHQFGNFTMLGDGRAILLGEWIDSNGKRVDLQLKGAGRTPYSRGGDGRAALGPMLREYIISEAMHGLGIPTSRSLAVIDTNEAVLRETELPGAILARVASSHIRVGTFQFAAQWGDQHDLKSLADYVIDRHYPHVKNADNPYYQLLLTVIEKQAKLVAQWQLVGFIHGVMNTDNMTISGETIDYGPCAFMDVYKPMTVFSSIDVQGRYAYGNQPYMAGWNLARLAESMVHLLSEDEETSMEMAQQAVTTFADHFQDAYEQKFRNKLGMTSIEEIDTVLMKDLLEMMQAYKADFTNTFRALTTGDLQETELHNTKEFRTWFEKWEQRVLRDFESLEEARGFMRQHNPSIIPRNAFVEEALQSAVAKGDYSKFESFVKALQQPYAYSKEQEGYIHPPKDENVAYRTYCGT